MAKHEYGDPVAFRGYLLVPKYTDGRMSLCDVRQPNELERDDEIVKTFHGPDARDKAKRWILAEEARQQYPRISMRRVSNSR